MPDTPKPSLDAAKIRSAIIERWRERLREEEEMKQTSFDPIALGIAIARALETHKDEIDEEITEAIAAAAERQSWRR